MAWIKQLGNLIGRAAAPAPLPSSSPTPRPSLDLDLAAAQAKAALEAGHAREDLGDWPGALALYLQALSLTPASARVHLNIGNVRLAMGDALAAQSEYQRAIELDPQHAGAHFNLGNAQLQGKEPFAAQRAYQRALALKPDFVDAWVALGNVQGDLGDVAAAVLSNQRAAALAPGSVAIQANLAAAYRTAGRLEEAAQTYAAVVALQPRDAAQRCELANVQRELGQIEAAVQTCREALEVDPQSAGTYSLLLFCLSHSPHVDSATLFKEHLGFAERFEAPLFASSAPHVRPHPNDRSPDRVLNVAFVSADLCNHAVASWFEPLLKLLVQDPTLAVTIHDTGGIDDAVSARMKQGVVRWLNVVELSPQALAEKVRADGVDVWVDLTGHTPGHRLLSFAQKPAPVQMSWIGYPGTTGLSSMDYYVGDACYLPPGEFDALFSEKIIRLPANAAFSPLEDSPPVNALPALSNGYVTLASFNRLDKIGHDVVVLWARLLHALPSARMMLAGMPQSGGHEQVLAWFAGEGIAAERLAFHPRSSMQDYLRLHHQADLCLDTFPYGGGTTTCHALWMGVPTLTLVGQGPAGNTSRSALLHLGLADEFVARDAADFVQKGLACVQNLARLAACRHSLRERFAQSPLSQPPVVAAAISVAMRQAWQRWCQGLEPVSFSASANKPRNNPPVS